MPFPVFIILVVGVPPATWRYLAGQFFVTEWCHHLNFFVMGPALSFAHGKAFGHGDLLAIRDRLAAAGLRGYPASRP